MGPPAALGTGSVESIFIVRKKHGPVESVREAELRSGRGVRGDHHDRDGVKRAVTAIDVASLAHVAKVLGHPVPEGGSRRNLVVRGVAIDALKKGDSLVIGEVVLRVHGACDPCEKLEKSIGAGAAKVLEGRGGLVLQVVQGGVVRVGEAVRVGDRVVRTTPRATSSASPSPERTGRVVQRGGKAAPTARTDGRPPDPSRFQQPLSTTGGFGEGRAAAGVRSSRQAALQAWYRQNARDLPWRRTSDPYAVWVSEVMCQQTQVSTVIPYWERFLARFPTVRALADAPLDAVTPYWSGLGYYARCRNMHAAARAIVETHGGEFPRDYPALLDLPGFGPYTAGAVGSIACGLEVPVVDGNVGRVLCRWEGWEVGVEEAMKRAWELAPSLVPAGHAGEWNQALMELGATVCTPAIARCPTCPVREHCASARRGDPTTFPLPKVRAARKPLHVASLVVRDGDGVLLVKRASSTLFGGLWELPSAEAPPGEALAKAALGVAKELLGRKASVRAIAQVEATLTHRDVTVELFEASGGDLSLPEGGRFAGGEALRELGLSTLAVRVLVAAKVPVPEGYGRRRAVPKGQRSLFGEPE